MSSSLFVNGIQKAYDLIIERYYENSALSKGLKKIGQWGKNSFIVKGIIELIAKDHFTVIKNKSSVFHGVAVIQQGVSKWLQPWLKQSGITAIATKWVLPLKNLGTACHALCCIGAGFFAARLVVLGIQVGLSKGIVLINGGGMVVLLLLSFIPVQKIAAAMNNNVVSKLMVWFFNN